MPSEMLKQKAMNEMFRPPAPSATLDIDILRSAVAIAEGGSIAVAATRVARTPAAVSMQIKKLEEMLGRVLFERTRQGMTPTADGEKLLEYARRMIELNRETVLAFAGPEVEGTVALAVIDSFGGVRLADVLAGFSRLHPKVTVNVKMGWTSQIAPALDAGAYDLVLLTPGGDVDWREGDLVLHEEPLAWIGREGGRAARLCPVPLSLADEGCAWRKLALEAIRGGQLDSRIAYVSNYDHGQLAAVQADLAVAPMPRSYLGPGLVELGARDGFPPLGVARIALRMRPDASQAGRTLACAIAESYGRVLPESAGCAGADAPGS